MELIFRPGLVTRSFAASDQDTSGATYQYFGFLTQDNNWFIQRFDQSTPNTILYRYATVKNNAGYPVYTDAWTNRSSLTYELYNVAGI